MLHSETSYSKYALTLLASSFPPTTTACTLYESVAQAEAQKPEPLRVSNNKSIPPK